MAELEFNLLMTLLGGGALLWARRRRPWVMPAAVVLAVLLGIGAALAPNVVPIGHAGFYSLRLAAWVAFLHAPLLLLAGAALVRRRAPRLSLAGLLAGLLLAAVSFTAFFIEPFRLQRTVYTVEHPDAPFPLRIALLADIQTATIGKHEQRALAMTAEGDPDLVLFAGDYVALGPFHPHLHDVRARFAALVRDAGLAPSLGAYAVKGDADAPGWEAAFVGTGVDASSDTRTLHPAPGLALTLLSQRDGHDPRARVPPEDGLHVVLGHGPDFALSTDVAGDLLLAGHTHGGQVVLPFLGPPITLSRIPRDWARGLSCLPDGRPLVVSAGIGMERGFAPQLRFLCPPEVVFVDIVPAREDAQP